ncbi:hypothetical protein E8E14_009610 [Neopestalotiopsis sp. 37M]|nr:hypothetical protein E8E14_009610 [Neopestalotiopsis sp. 37M]
MERQNSVNMFWRRLGSTLSLTDTRNVPEDESRSGSVCTLTTKLAEESSLISASQDTTFLSTEDDEDDDHLETSQKEGSGGPCVLDNTPFDIRPSGTDLTTSLTSLFARAAIKIKSKARDSKTSFYDSSQKPEYPIDAASGCLVCPLASGQMPWTEAYLET